MRLLGLETSSAVATVALTVEGEVLEREIASPREQAGLLLALVDELLATAALTLGQLDGVAFGRGPGSFTGLRLAAAVAQGFGLAAGVPLLPVSSLLSLAEHARRSYGVERSLVAVDARMGEVYSAAFEAGSEGLTLAAPERLCSPGALTAPARPGWTAVGDGFAAYAEVLAELTAGADRVLPSLCPTARDLFPQAARDLAAGRTAAPQQALPVYLREDDAWQRRAGP